MGMGTLGPNEHKTRRSTSGGHFIKNSHGGPRGPKKPSAVGAFLRREKAVHAPVSDHTRKRGRSVLSQHMEVTVEKSSAESMIDMVVDEKNREAWAVKNQAQVKAAVAAFDGFLGMLRETFKEDAKRRGGLR